MLDGLGFNVAVRHDYIDVTSLVLAYKFGDFEFWTIEGYQWWKGLSWRQSKYTFQGTLMILTNYHETTRVKNIVQNNYNHFFIVVF